MKGLVFREEDHTYYFNDSVVPSVTTALNEWVLTTIYKVDYYINTFTGNAVAKEMFTVGADHGSAVHLAIAYYIADELDEDHLDPAILAAVNQFKLWKDEHVDEILMVEEPMYSLRYRYAGTSDIICILKRKYGGRRIVTDIKTGAHDLSGPQMSAYENLYREKSKYRGAMDRYVLELPKSGDSYKFKAEKGRGADDFKFFLNKLAVYNFMKGK